MSTNNGLEGETDNCHPQNHPQNLIPKVKRRSPFFATVYSKILHRRQLKTEDEVPISLTFQIPSGTRGWLKTSTELQVSEQDPGCGDATDIPVGPQETPPPSGGGFVTPIVNEPVNVPSIPATRGIVPQDEGPVETDGAVKVPNPTAVPQDPGQTGGREGDIPSNTQISQPDIPPSAPTQQPLNPQPTNPPGDNNPNTTNSPIREPDSSLIPPSDSQNPPEPTNQSGPTNPSNPTSQVQDGRPQETPEIPTQTANPYNPTIPIPETIEGSYVPILSSSTILTTYTSNGQIYTSSTLLLTTLSSSYIPKYPTPQSTTQFTNQGHNNNISPTNTISTASGYTTTNDFSPKPAVIGGAVAGSLAVLLVAFTGFYFFLLRRRQKDREMGLE
ncbi:hypothetical protein TWF281_003266 [Arthrobotrys megalospora]